MRFTHILLNHDMLNMLDMSRSNDIKNPFAIDVGCNSVLVDLLSDIWFVNCCYIHVTAVVTIASQMTENADRVTQRTCEIK